MEPPEQLDALNLTPKEYWEACEASWNPKITDKESPQSALPLSGHGQYLLWFFRVADRYFPARWRECTQCGCFYWRQRLEFQPPGSNYFCDDYCNQSFQMKTPEHLASARSATRKARQANAEDDRQYMEAQDAAAVKRLRNLK